MTAAHVLDDTARLKTSEILLNVVRDSAGTRLNLSDLIAGLQDRSFGLLMLLLALPNCLPAPGIPGVSTICGVPIAFFAFQLMMGQHQPWLPRRLLQRSIGRAEMLRFLIRTLPYVQRVERVLRPRLPELTAPTAERAIGFACFVLAVILALPIPFGNFLPAWGIALFALAIVERDGAFVIGAAVTSVVGVALVGAIVLIGVRTVLFLLTSVWGPWGRRPSEGHPSDGQSAPAGQRRGDPWTAPAGLVDLVHLHRDAALLEIAPEALDGA